MRTILPIFFSAFLLLTSCKKDKYKTADKLVFGTHFGECVGDCFRVFSVDNKRVQHDTATHYLDNYLTYTFNGSITLNDSLYQQANYLLNEIPIELTTASDKIYGCPDCYDQGGVYVEINLNGETRRFDIDNGNSSDQSQEIIDFKNKLRDAVILLN